VPASEAADRIRCLQPDLARELCGLDRLPLGQEAKQRELHALVGRTEGLDAAGQLLGYPSRVEPRFHWPRVRVDGRDLQPIRSGSRH
jgi:hypothetical protein